MKDRIIAVNSNCYHGYSLKDAIEGIKAAGFKYIELSAINDYTEHVFYTQSYSELLEAKDLLEANGVIPFALSIHTNLMDDNCYNGLINNIRLAPFFNSKYIVTSIGDAGDKYSDYNDADIAKRISALIPYLDKYDLNIVIETHGNHPTGEKMCKLLKYIDCDRVKINYDTANTIYWANMSTDEMIADFSNSVHKIGFVHLKDKLGTPHEWNFPALGAGNVPFDKIISLLSDNSNYCPCSVEIEFTEAGPKNLEEINDAILNSSNYLKNLGLIL